MQTFVLYCYSVLPLARTLWVCVSLCFGFDYAYRPWRLYRRSLVWKRVWEKSHALGGAGPKSARYRFHRGLLDGCAGGTAGAPGIYSLNPLYFTDQSCAGDGRLAGTSTAKYRLSILAAVFSDGNSRASLPRRV